MSLPRICSLESRRADEMRNMLTKLGAVPFVAPSMREVKIDDPKESLAIAERLFQGEIDGFVFLTGVGMKAMLEGMETKHSRESLLAEIEKRTLIVRGPKPVAVLKEWGLKHDYRAAEPNGWREIIALFDQHKAELQGKTIAIQEYGKRNDDLARELQIRNCDVLSVLVYQWALPDDTAPLLTAIEKMIAGDFDILMLTSAQQIHNALTLAGQHNLLDPFRDALSRIDIASIGPTCSETIRDLNFDVTWEPQHHKMGHLVKHTIDSFNENTP